MDGPTGITSGQGDLLRPRQSLQNIGDKKEDEDENKKGRDFQAFGPDGFTFLDFVDIINPLQHIPVVSSLYRDMTGDEIDPGSRMAGGALFGGPIGIFAAMTNIALEKETGMDMGDHAIAWITGEDAATAEGGWTEPGPQAFVTAAGQQAAVMESPIGTNIEVLDWARREAERNGSALFDRNEAAETKSSVDQNIQTANVTEIPILGSQQIAANIEVLNWARQESQSLRSMQDKVEAFETREEADARDTIRDNDTEKRSLSGLTQAQLTGATAPLGGWFSETMLAALAKYETSANLGHNPDRSAPSGNLQRVEPADETSTED